MDAKNFTDGFDLPPGSWPGTLGDEFFLGGDWVQNNKGLIGDFEDLAALGAYGAMGSAYSESRFTPGLKAGLEALGDKFLKGSLWLSDKLTKIGDSIGSLFGKAQGQNRVDPLVLDLDGDGIESVGTNIGIMFDHNADGVKTNTGWVKADDGILVLDKNQNGLIDNGTELFGNHMLIQDGYVQREAKNGFEALAAQDSNHDGKFDAQDSQWQYVKLWQDVNQDGISQANELSQLQDHQISSLNVASAVANQTLSNGNRISAKGTFTYSDGRIANMADIDLVDNTFKSEFSDVLPISTDVMDLPFMQGSGKVRDLWQAASSSTALKEALAAYSAAPTREAQKALLEPLLLAWADTSGMYATYKLRLTEGRDSTDIEVADANLISLSVNGERTMRTGFASVDAYAQKMHILEAFNGRYFFGLPDEGTTNGTAGGASTGSGAGISNVASVRVILLSLTKLSGVSLDQSFDALKESVYGALIAQTRFAEMLGQIGLVFTDAGVTLDFSAVEANLLSRISNNRAEGLADLMDFTRYVSPSLQAAGWRSDELLTNIDFTANELAWLHEEFGLNTALTTFIRDEEKNETLIELTRGDLNAQYIINGYGGDDIIYGASDKKYTLLGGDGNDRIIAGSGNDTINGEAGNDILEGGLGNDTLSGGLGNDVYLFGKGDGQDVISHDTEALLGKFNVLQFKANVLPTEVVATQASGTSLVLSIIGTTDSVTIQYFFYDRSPENINNGIQQVQFSNGTVWDMATLVAKVLEGTEGADNIKGIIADDMITGQAGADSLYGGNGSDTLIGGADNDFLSGENGNDLLNGGLGNDTLSGGLGNDIYIFAKGDGQDTINADPDADNLVNKLNILKFKDNVLPSEMMAVRVGDNLELSIMGTTDKVTIKSFFYGNDPMDINNGIQQVHFSDGTVWDIAALTAKVFAGTAGVDKIRGTIGNDIITGQTGTDSLYGGEGNDSLMGGADNDRLYGSVGDDVLEGGSGNDVLFGEAGNDIYLFGKGDGQDTISSDIDTSASKFNVLKLKDNVLASDVIVTRSGNDLVLSIAGTTDKISLGFFFYNDNPANTGNAVQQVQFSDGTTWDIATLTAKIFAGTAGVDNIKGTIGNDIITGQAGTDSLYGGEGNDSLIGGADNDALLGDSGHDTLNGGSGNDSLTGGVGCDVLDGDLGNDMLIGGLDNDTYLFSKGVDSLTDNDAVANNSDTLVMSTDITAEQLWFRRVGSHLEISVIGTTDKTTISNWYASNAYHIEQFKTADGKILYDHQVDTLVAAMANFTPPVAGQTALPANYKDALSPAISASWT